jgi:hypothetical protein
MDSGLNVVVEWLPAPGVSTPELAATWARYEIWLRGRCVTQVEAFDGTLRRSVYGSLYPLAEWIASNWWVINSHIRPTGVETRYWTWKNLTPYPWLRYHNLRASGDGMAWPDLTVVTDGATAQLVWVPDSAAVFGSVRFAVGGRASIRTQDAVQGLASVVDKVIGRLAESGLSKTRLSEEWAAVAGADTEEVEFCHTVARLGMDPYSIDDQMVEDVLAVSDGLTPDVAADFFDTADPEALSDAAAWARRAITVARKASNRADMNLQPLRAAVDPIRKRLVGFERPWEAGYEMARTVRRELGVPDTDSIDLAPWVGMSQITGESYGIQGIGTVNEGRCGVVLGSLSSGRPNALFGRARALGRALISPDQDAFVLSGARGHNERVAGAFAAELLAPAEGIRTTLPTTGEQGDAAIEAVARHFRVSPLLVRHQYDNQLASAIDLAIW